MGMMQEKILKSIENTANRLGLEFVFEPMASNLGFVYLMKDTVTKLSFGYSFQDQYAILQFFPEGKKIVRTCGFTHENCILDCTIKYEKLQEGLEKVEKLISGICPELEVSQAEIPDSELIYKLHRTKMEAEAKLLDMLWKLGRSETAKGTPRKLIELQAKKALQIEKLSPEYLRALNRGRTASPLEN